MNPTANFEIVTAQKAATMLLKNKQNRPINDNNLAGIIAEMKRGCFRITGESIKVSKNGNLLDGQHRLTAIVKTGIDINMLVVRGLDDDAFKYIDTGRTRKASDVLGIEGVKNPARVASMIKFIINFNRGAWSAAANSDGRKSTRLTNADVSDYNEKNGASLADSIPYGFNKENRLIAGGVLASFHYIFKAINPDSADDFCHKLASGEGLTKESPIHLLRQKMLSDIRSTRRMGPIERAALICKSWNLYRKDKQVSILKWDSVKEPFPKPI
jgi:hypothetical protein